MYQRIAVEEHRTEEVRHRRSTWIGSIAGLGRFISSNRKAAAGAVVLAIIVVVAVGAPIIAPYNPDASEFMPTQGPSAQHLLGTTSYGQDVFSQVIWGAQPSLLIGFGAGLIATIISVLVGVTAAYQGGTTDYLLSMLMDIFLVLPALPLMIVIAAYLRGGGAWVLIAVISITGWAFGARQLRAQALSLRNREFLESARIRGERSLYVIVFEMLPTMISLIAANFLGAALYAVLAAAGLQFLGLGDINAISWGTMLYWAQNNEALMTGAPLWDIVPGVCIALLGAAFALLNYAFDELGNPALRTSRRKRKQIPIGADSRGQ